MFVAKRRLIHATVLLGALYCHGAGAGPIYTYQGNPLTNNVSAPFSATDVITGFVEFATDPTAGETGKSDVIDFSFSAGPLTITLADALHSRFLFDFDASGAIVDWIAVAEGDTTGGTERDEISTWTLYPEVTGATGTINYGDNIDQVCIDERALDPSVYPADDPVRDSTCFVGAGSHANNDVPGTWSLAVAAVPEPPVALLLGLGLAGAFGARARARR